MNFVKSHPMTATANVLLDNIGQATADQLATFLRLKAENIERVLLTAAMENGYLIVNYRTKGERYCTAIFDQYGEATSKKYFHNWNEINHEPFNPIIFTTS